jgi:hypothetical protein
MTISDNLSGGRVFSSGTQRISWNLFFCIQPLRYPSPPVQKTGSSSANWRNLALPYDYSNRLSTMLQISREKNRKFGILGCLRPFAIRPNGLQGRPAQKIGPVTGLLPEMVLRRSVFTPPGIAAFAAFPGPVSLAHGQRKSLRGEPVRLSSLFLPLRRGRQQVIQSQVDGECGVVIDQVVGDLQGG